MENAPAPKGNGNFNAHQTVLFLVMAAGLVLSVLTGVTGYYLGKKFASPTLPPVPPPASTVSPTKEPEGVFCTMDAKICPDGSAVGRMPPKCEFAPCPASSKPSSSSPSSAATESVDFAACKVGTGFNRTVGFGSTSLEILKDEGGTCQVRIKNETEGSSVISQCDVPQQVGTLTFAIGDTGADFSSLEKYCHSTTRNDIRINQ